MPSHYNQEGGSLTLSAFKIIANKNRRGVKGVRPLEEGELHYKNSNFMGPGTVYQKYKNWKPYNRPDAVAKVHDAEYDRIFNSKEMSKKEKAEAIRAADKKMIASLKALGKLEGEEEDYRQAGLKGIGFKKKLENVSQTLAKLLLGEWAGKKPEEEGQEGEGKIEEKLRKIYNIPKDIALKDAKIKLTPKQKKDFLKYLNYYATIAIVDEDLGAYSKKLTSKYLFKLIDTIDKMKRVKTLKQLETINNLYKAIQDTAEKEYKDFNEKYPPILKSSFKEIFLFDDKEDRKLIQLARTVHSRLFNDTIFYADLLKNHFYKYLKNYLEKDKVLNDIVKGKARTKDGKPLIMYNDIMKYVIKPMADIKNEFDKLDPIKINNDYIKDILRYFKKQKIKIDEKELNKLKDELMKSYISNKTDIGKKYEKFMKEVDKYVKETDKDYDDFNKKNKSEAKSIEEKEEEEEEGKEEEGKEEEGKEEEEEEEEGKEDQVGGNMSIIDRIFMNNNRF